MQGDLVLKGTEETGVALVPHQIWKALVGGTLKRISSLEGIFSTRPEKPLRDWVFVGITHNNIGMLGLNHLGFKRQTLNNHSAFLFISLRWKKALVGKEWWLEGLYI